MINKGNSKGKPRFRLKLNPRKPQGITLGDIEASMVELKALLDKRDKIKRGEYE